jgi:hypothetical protein
MIYTSCPNCSAPQAKELCECRDCKQYYCSNCQDEYLYNKSRPHLKSSWAPKCPMCGCTYRHVAGYIDSNHKVDRYSGYSSSSSTNKKSSPQANKIQPEPDLQVASVDIISDYRWGGNNNIKFKTSSLYFGWSNDYTVTVFCTFLFRKTGTSSGFNSSNNISKWEYFYNPGSQKWSDRLEIDWNIKYDVRDLDFLDYRTDYEILPMIKHRVSYCGLTYNAKNVDGRRMDGIIPNSGKRFIYRRGRLGRNLRIVNLL